MQSDISDSKAAFNGGKSDHGNVSVCRPPSTDYLRIVDYKLEFHKPLFKLYLECQHVHWNQQIIYTPAHCKNNLHAKL